MLRTTARRLLLASRATAHPTSHQQQQLQCFFSRPLTTLGSPEDRTTYPASPPPFYPPGSPHPPRTGDPVEDLKHVHASSTSTSSPSTTTQEQQDQHHLEEAVHAEEASTFLHTLQDHDPAASCPKCLTGEHHSCPELGTHDDGPRDPAYAQAEGPATPVLEVEERKRIVQSRARDMDDEKPPCVIQEQHRLHEQLEKEEAGRFDMDEHEEAAAGAQEQQPPHEGDQYRRAGQLRITRETGPGEVEKMIETAGYGSHGCRESGKGYGDVFWEGGVSVFLSEEGAKQLFVEGAAGQTKAEIEAGEDRANKVREVLSPGGVASPDPRAVHNRVLRTLKEEGEMDSLRRDDGPGGQLANEQYSKGSKAPPQGEDKKKEEKKKKKKQEEAGGEVPVKVTVAEAVGKKMAETVEVTVIVTAGVMAAAEMAADTLVGGDGDGGGGGSGGSGGGAGGGGGEEAGAEEGKEEKQGWREEENQEGKK